MFVASCGNDNLCGWHVSNCTQHELVIKLHVPVLIDDIIIIV